MQCVSVLGVFGLVRMNLSGCCSARCGVCDSMCCSVWALCVRLNMPRSNLCVSVCVTVCCSVCGCSAAAAWLQCCGCGCSAAAVWLQCCGCSVAAVLWLQCGCIAVAAVWLQCCGCSVAAVLWLQCVSQCMGSSGLIKYVNHKSVSCSVCYSVCCSVWYGV